MASDRIIDLLDDEDISIILSCLRFGKQEYKKQNNKDFVNRIDVLTSIIGSCDDLGVITKERI